MRHCNHSRRIWIRVVEETAAGEVIDFGADELTLDDEKGDCSKRQGRRSAAPSMPCVGEGQELTPV
jgi:hypothetical protein